MADILKSNLFFAASLDLKGQLTQNFVRSITVTGRSKMAKNSSYWKSRMAAMGPS